MWLIKVDYRANFFFAPKFEGNPLFEEASSWRRVEKWMAELNLINFLPASNKAGVELTQSN